MKKMYVLFLSLFLSGCVTVDNSPPHSSAATAEAPRAIMNGLSKEEVASVVGNSVVIGYEAPTLTSADYQPITLANPYRVETLTARNKSFEVQYYFAGVKESDDVVTDEELTPYVFEQNKLIGYGWPFFKKFKEKNKL